MLVLGGLVLVVLVGVGLVSAAFVALPVARDAAAGRRASADARAAVLAPDPDAARSAFDRAERSFASASRRLRSVAALPLRVLPVARGHVSAVGRVATASASAARAGRLATGALAAAPPEGWGLVQGRIDVAAVRRAAAILTDAAGLGQRSLRELGSGRRGWLIGPVAREVREAETRLTGAVDGLTKARDGARVLPRLMGGDGARRYLVMFANRSEMRGTGGFLGYGTVVEARGGRLSVLEGSGRPTEAFPPLASTGVHVPGWFVHAHGRYRATKLWQNINTSPDFPTVGGAIVEAASRTVGPLDGVIQIDAAGIGALLYVTGSVRVPSWPSAINADNIADVTEHDQYRVYPDRERRTALVDELVTTAFNHVLRSRLNLNATTLSALGARAAGGNVKLFSVHADEERLLRALGVAGAVDRGAGASDVLGVITENASASKGDWFLRRRVTYRVALDPESDSARGDLDVTITNSAPTRGEPAYVIGPNSPGLEPGDNRQTVLLVRTPADELHGLSIAGKPQSAIQAREGSMRAYHNGITVRAGESVKMVARLTVPGALRSDRGIRRYRLHVLRQPVLRPDFYELRVQAPPGWRIEGQSRFTGPLQRDVVLDVTLHREPLARVVDVVFARPWRAARALYSRIF